MFTSVDEVAHPTLRVRGLFWRSETILITGDEPWRIIGNMCQKPQREAEERHSACGSKPGRRGSLLR